MSTLKLKRSDALAVYRLMCRTRALQEELIINRRAINGPLLTAIGSEAVSIPALFALAQRGAWENSVFGPGYREVYGVAVAVDEFAGAHDDAAVYDLVRNHFGRATGGNRGRDNNVHWGHPEQNIIPFMCSDTGRTVGITAGALSKRMWDVDWDNLPVEKRPVGVATVGEGAFQQGGVYEALNHVAVLKLPFILIINRNGMSLFTKPEEEHGMDDLSKRALAFAGMVGISADGNDAAAVYAAMNKALNAAQSRHPVILELKNYRLTGHNEDQVKRTFSYEELSENRKFFDVESIFGVDAEGLEEFRRQAENEPLARAQKYLVSQGILNGETSEHPLHDTIIDEERERIQTIVAEVLSEPEITVAEDKKDRSVFPSFSAPYGSDGGETKRMKYNQAFAHIVKTLMHEDEGVIYRGEDVATKEGGVLGLTRGILGEVKPWQIANFGISEEALAAFTAGWALAGGRSFGEFQFGHFFWDGAVILRVLGPQWFQKKLRFPVTYIFPSGVLHGGGSGEYHEAWMERYLVPMSGIVVIAPSNAYDLVGLVRAAHEYDGPVAVMLQMSAGGTDEFVSDIPNVPYTLPLGKANIVREGSDCTVVAYGAACVAAARNEADVLAKQGISIEVIDLRTVYPWDTETIVWSVQKTGRLVIMHEDHAIPGSVGQMLKGELLEHDELLTHLITPSIHVLGASTPFIPSQHNLVWDRLPYERVDVDATDEKGRTYKKTIHRSSKLAALVHEGMRFNDSPARRVS